jgi:hypothetical protein
MMKCFDVVAAAADIKAEVRYKADERRREQ